MKFGDQAAREVMVYVKGVDCTRYGVIDSERKQLRLRMREVSSQSSYSVYSY